MSCDEKRKMDRFDLELPAWISVADENGQPQTFKVVTRNICAGGAYLQTDKPLAVGTDVEIDLVLPLDRLQKMGARPARIDVSGAVVRAESQGIVVCFDKRYQISPLDK